MSWQTPKTDWQAADGVRDSDFNRIEGNMLELYNESARANITVYISPTGSDTSGAGTSDSPYMTFAKALSVLPKDLSNFTVTINVATGTYDEDVNIVDFKGIITIAGAYGRYAYVKSFTVSNCICKINNIEIRTTTSGIVIKNAGRIFSNSNMQSENSPDGVSLSGCSSLIISSMLTVRDSSGSAVFVTELSSMYALQLSGSGSNVGVRVAKGGKVAFGSNSLSVSAAAYQIETGGRVYSGSQTSVPNY